MTETEYNEIEKVSRDYVDNFSFKDLALNEIMPKYFEEETSNMTVGLNGMLTEYIGTVAEDGFNTASTLLLETFPTRATMENSIYSNAAIFQLSNVFSKAARCDFLIVIPERDIIQNFISKQGDPYSHFYLDKDTVIYIENIPFSLDYDIDLKAIYRETQKGYVYSARYIMPSNDSSVFLNTLSPIKDPYIKTRRTSNGLIVLQVNMGQYRRKVSYESIIDNASINFPTVDVSYSEEIALMDVLYKEPGEESFEQLKLQVRFSQPSKDPFCYYRKISDGKIELSFTTKDTYFQPSFNSELTIITYSTMGEDGNFDFYDGENISLIKCNDKYQYDYPWAVSVKPLSGSEGGRKALSKEALRDLTVEGFSTANAKTTTHDLQVYFNNYKHLYDSEVLFIKKRDDTAERLYSAFLYTKKDDYFYPTNTLTINTNLLYLDKKEGGYYNIEPGFLFTYKETNIYRVIPIFYILNRGVPTGDYYKKNTDGTYNLYHSDGTLGVDVKDENYIKEEIKAGRLKQNPNQYYILENDDYVLHNPDGSKAERVYKTLDGKIYYKYRDRVYYAYDAEGTLYDDTPISEKEIMNQLQDNQIIAVTDDVYNDPILLTEDELLNKFRKGKLTFDSIDAGETKNVDYLFDSEKELKARIDYLNYFEEYRNKQHEPDMSISEYIFRYTFKDYKNDNGIDNRLMVFDENIQEISNQHKFLFTNPFLMSITKSAGLVGFYMTSVDESSTLDFINENDADTFTQFITYTLKMSRDINQDKKYTFELVTLPSISVTKEEPIIDEETIFDPTNKDQFISTTFDKNLPNDLMRYDKSKLVKNDLRVILSFHKPETEDLLGYLEMIPVLKTGSDQFTYRAEFITDDYVIADNEFRVTHRCPYCGAIKHGSTITDKHKYTGYYICETPNCPSNNGINKGFKDGIINVLESDDIWLSMENCVVRVNMLYRNPFDEEHPTDNIFVQYDKTYEGYRWTNIYSTISEPLSFIKPMNMLRTNIEYLDYHKKGIDALDCCIYDIPFLKYSLISYRHEGPEVTKVDEIDDIQKFNYFVNSYVEHYDILNEAQEYLRNNTNIDTKFYNTYGKSTNFVIGESGELIDTVNIKIAFDVWLTTNTDHVYAETTLKTFIKEYIENINSEGTNDLYISNLIREIENNLAFVHHLKFKGINDYDTSYQAIKNRAISLNDLSKEERRHFVPDLLTVNRSNIHLTFEEIE